MEIFSYKKTEDDLKAVKTRKSVVLLHLQKMAVNGLNSMNI